MGPKESNQTNKTMIEYVKFGQNPLFGSRDNVWKPYFASKFDIQNARQYLIKSLTPSKQCICASLGLNPPTGSEDNLW